MRLTDVVTVTKRYDLPSGSQIGCPSISDTTVDKLIDNLSTQGVKIDSNFSEKLVKYSAQLGNGDPKKRTSMVPLSTHFLTQVEIAAFYLRDGRGLELEVCDQNNAISAPPEGIIGGSIQGDAGVACALSVEGETVDLSIIDKVRKALEETYKTKVI